MVKKWKIPVKDLIIVIFEVKNIIKEISQLFEYSFMLL